MANENDVTFASLLVEKLARMNGVKINSINMDRVVPHIEAILETIQSRKRAAVNAWKTIHANKRKHVEAGKKAWATVCAKKKAKMKNIGKPKITKK